MSTATPAAPVLLLDGTTDPRVVAVLRDVYRIARRRAERGDADAARQSLDVAAGIHILLRRLGLYAAYDTLLRDERGRTITSVRRATAQARRAARRATVAAGG